MFAFYLTQDKQSLAKLQVILGFSVTRVILDIDAGSTVTR
jgi:hypothetical protein